MCVFVSNSTTCIDISDFVAEQYEHVKSGDYESLMTPTERVYVPEDPSITTHIGRDEVGVETVVFH